MKKNYLELTYLKGIAIILVILGHSFSFTGFDLVDKERYFIYYYIYNTIYSFHMPLFFIVSGFLANKEYQIKEFYFSKIKRLLIPYIFINIIDYIPRHVFPTLVNNSQNSIERVIFYSGVATWFVYTLFIVFLIFPIIDRYILKKDKYYVFFIILIIFNIIFYPKIENIKIFTINRVIFYLIYFYLGYILKKFYTKIIEKKVLPNIYIMILTSIIFIFFNYQYTNSIYTTVLFPCIGFILILNLSLYLKKLSKVNFLEFCGKNSLTFYLLEPFFSVPYRVGLVKLLGIQNHFLIVILFFILKLFSVYISAVVINKIPIISFLFGNKVKKEKK